MVGLVFKVGDILFYVCTNYSDEEMVDKAWQLKIQPE
jgi:hypothetical protein